MPGADAVAADVTAAVAPTRRWEDDAASASPVNEAAAATALDIEGGESGTTVASVNEQSNNPGGYKISVSSLNDGKLVNTTDTNSFVNYQISYDQAANFQPSTSGATA